MKTQQSLVCLFFFFAVAKQLLHILKTFFPFSPFCPQEAGRAHSLERDLAMLISKFKLPDLALPAAPVPCTDKPSHGEGSCPNQGFTPVIPPDLGDQTE